MTTLDVARPSALRRRVFTADGLFLALIGGSQVIFELLSHYTGKGPLNTIFQDSYLTIGWVEAHGQALLIGVLLLAVARRDGRRFWHWFALAEHALLGTANLVFWNSFGHFDLVPMGVVATAAHALFVVLHAVCLKRRP
jgi:hypothetical protein